MNLIEITLLRWKELIALSKYLTSRESSINCDDISSGLVDTDKALVISMYKCEIIVEHALHENSYPSFRNKSKGTGGRTLQIIKITVREAIKWRTNKINLETSPPYLTRYILQLHLPMELPPHPWTSFHFTVNNDNNLPTYHCVKLTDTPQYLHNSSAHPRYTKIIHKLQSSIMTNDESALMTQLLRNAPTNYYNLPYE